MRRTSLSSKLLLAALPLVLAVGALLTITVLADLDRVNEAERDATVGTTWSVLLDASQAVNAEQQAAIDATLGRSTLNLTSAAGTPDADPFDRATTATDAALAALLAQLAEQHGFAEFELSQANGALDLGRQLARSWAHNPSVAPAAASSPFDQYEIVMRELHTIGNLLQSAAGDPETGRTLLGVAQLSDAHLATSLYTGALAAHQLDPNSARHLIDARAALNDVLDAYDQFDVTTTPEWSAAFRQSGIRARMAGPQSHVNRALNGDLTAIDGVADAANALEAIVLGDEIQRQLLDEVVTAAEAEAGDITTTTRVRLAVIAGAVVLATVLAWLITRSITRRVRAVAAGANAVATDQLPALVDALRDPRGGSLPAVAEVSTKGGDELTELATSFNTLQRTLLDVAEEQMAVLRRGVSDLFVTMARRNRSLVDRQLALLDQFEAEIEDPEILDSYYQLDHLATRMRRNSESLLVLANAEPRRGRVGPTDVDTVVRAAIGEIEDYRRVQIASIDPLRVRGAAVADVAHLLAELLDNATAFSPPESLVEVGGFRVADGYQIRVTDTGVGMPEYRLEQLNDLLRNPPVVGLSVEPTLGMSVVSLLAHKHGITVTLTATPPGLTVDVVLPESVFAEEAPPPTPVRDPEEARLIAALEADFNRMDALAADPPVPADQESGASAPETDLPTRASGGLDAISALASYRAGAEAASHDLANASAEDAESTEAEHAAPTPDRSESAPPLPAPSAGAAPAREFAPPSPLSSSPVQFPAPPPLPVSPSLQPVVPPPPPRLEQGARPVVPSLPLRRRGASSAAALAGDMVADTVKAPPGPELAAPVVALPTRSRSGQHYTGADPSGESVASAASPLDANELRARLRAFQTEFRSAQAGAPVEPSPAPPAQAEWPSLPGDDRA